MFRSVLYPLILLVVIISSCNHTPERSVIEKSEVLSVTDSLLMIVDDEFNSIKETNKIHEEEFHVLENTVIEYEKTLINDTETIKDLQVKIFKLKTICDTKDSINYGLSLKIKRYTEQLDSLKNKLRNTDVVIEKTILKKDSIEIKYLDSINILNTKIEFLNNIIYIENRKDRKLKLMEYDSLYFDNR